MMSKDCGRRIATATGAVLSGSAEEAREDWFEPSFWSTRGELTELKSGRGAAWFVGASAGWVLRHYLRGGYAARLSRDRYLWCGEPRVRAFAEFRLLDALHARALPVPRPVAARYRRSGLLYRCDLITERIVGTDPLSAVLERAALAPETWWAVGAALARLHAAGADHADLNAHNILIDARGAVSVIDFDRGRLRAPGGWARANLARLRHSLRKITRGMPADRFPAAAWHSLMAGYSPGG